MKLEALVNQENEAITVADWYRLMFDLGWENDCSPQNWMTKSTELGEAMAMPVVVVSLPNGNRPRVVRYQDVRNYNLNKTKVVTHTNFYRITLDEASPVHQEEFLFRMPNWALPTPEQWKNHCETFADKIFRQP